MQLEFFIDSFGSGSGSTTCAGSTAFTYAGGQSRVRKSRSVRYSRLGRKHRINHISHDQLWRRNDPVERHPGESFISVSRHIHSLSDNQRRKWQYRHGDEDRIGVQEEWPVSTFRERLFDIRAGELFGALLLFARLRSGGRFVEGACESMEHRRGLEFCIERKPGRTICTRVHPAVLRAEPPRNHAHNRWLIEHH